MAGIASAGRPPRVRPDLGAGLAVLVAYSVVAIGIQAASGIPYDEWFESTSNALRAPFPAFLAGAVLLIGFTIWSRWDGVWRDPARLPMSFLLWLPIALFALSVSLLLADADWSGTSGALLAVIVATTALTGLCEELLFRGLLLRCARSRWSEAVCALLVSAVFGLFHLVNLALGAPAGDTVAQVFSAAVGGVCYYLLRRAWGLLIVPMVAHALFDLAVILAPDDAGTAGVLAGVVNLVFWLSALVAIGTLAGSQGSRV